MATRTHITLCLSILILMTGCNGDIFIDDYMSKGHIEVTVSETDNSKDINFRSDNWALINVIFKTSTPYTSTAYTIEGEITHLPFEEKELGTVHYTNDFIDVRVEKKSGRKITVTLNENLMNEDLEMNIEVSNQFKHENISVQLAPTQKYHIESIVYDWDKFKTYEGHLKEVQSQIFHNNSDSPLTIGVFPYSKSSREITFNDPMSVWDEDLFTNLLGTPLPEITIPDLADGKPVLNETTVAFGTTEQHLSIDLDKELIEYVTIDGFDKRKITVFNEMKSYSVPYSLYMSNPRTGKKLTFSGQLNSSEPIDYFILKRVADEK